MSEYETYKKEQFDKRQTIDEDEEEKTDEEEISTKRSTSYMWKKPLFTNDSLEAWMKATGGKTKGRILGMRPGDDSLMLSKTKKSKTKMDCQTREEIEKKKKDFDIRVKEAVNKELETTVNQKLKTVNREMEALKQQQKDSLEFLASMKEGNTSNTSQAIVPSKNPPNPPLDLQGLLKKISCIVL